MLYNKTNIFGKQVWRVPTNQKIVALTFDDGPNEPYTSQILNLLEKYNQHATFFVVGINVERNQGVVKLTQQKGHEVALHSYNHQFRSYFFDPKYNLQIDKTVNCLKAEGIVPKHFRSPWLFRTPILAKNIRKRGFGVLIGGYFSSLREPMQIDGRQIASSAIKRIKPGAIVIFHDGYNAQPANRGQTVIATEIILEYLLKNGYKSVTITDLLALKD